MKRPVKYPLLTSLIGVIIKEMKIMSRYIGTLVIVISLPYMLSGFFIGVGYTVGGEAATRNFYMNTGVESPLLYLTLGGTLMMTSMFLIENTSGIIREEQLIGTFELHYLTPNNTVLLWFFHAIASSLLFLGVFAVNMSLVIAVAGSLLNPYEWLLAFVIVLLGILPLAGLGLVVAALTVRFKEVWAVANIISSFIAMLSGFYYPLEVFPGIVQFIAQVVPTSHASELLKKIVSGMSAQLSLAERLALMVALALGYLALGKVFYSRWEDDARRKGELSKY